MTLHTGVRPTHGAAPGRILLLIGLLSLAGCTYALKYNPGYLAAARRPASAQTDGKALIYTTSEEDRYTFSGAPTSITGSTTTAVVPVGEIVREAARAAFTDVFRGGADTADTLGAAAGYRVIAEPRTVDFKYQYNQLRNLGFAITPIVEMTLEVRVLDANGAMTWHRVYPSGEVSGPSYMVNLSPAEEINKLAHKAAYDLLVKAAADIVTELPPRGPAPAAAAGSAAAKPGS